LAERAVDAELAPHRESGALVELMEQPGVQVHLEPHAMVRFHLRVPETTENAWIGVREAGASLAVSGKTVCGTGKQERTTVRQVATPMRSPWFDGDVGEMEGARIAVVNTSDSVAFVAGCYSGGVMVSNPNLPGGAALRPLCSSEFREQIPPFSARQFPVVRDGNTHFSLRTAGSGIALQMLRLLDAGTQLYQVDSSITFGQ
jgi:hypothetical protein